MRKPISTEDLWRIERIGAISASPDGTRAVCAVTQYSMENNNSSTQLWLLRTDASAPPRRLTTHGAKNSRPAWSPRGDCIGFLGTREQEGHKDEVPQLYLVSPDGGEAQRAAQVLPGIESFRWLPDGRGIVFAAWVWPELKGAKAQARRYKEHNERKTSGYATSEAQHCCFDHRHPMARVVHLLRLDLASGRITDLFEGTPFELPRDDLAPEPFDVSPDGRCVAFAFDSAPVKVAGQRRAIAELELATPRVRRIADAPDWDFDLPRYSPDGRQVAVLAAQIGRKHTMPIKPALLDRGGHWRALGTQWDHEAGAAPVWSRDGHALYLSAESRGRNPLWRCDLASDSFEIVTAGGWVQGFDIAGSPGDELVLTMEDAHSHPVRVFARRMGGKAGGERRRLERFNDALLKRLDFGETQEVTLTGALGEAVQMWLTFPPGFDARRKHPVMQVIHGGPFVASGDSFNYRWNAHLLASRGHVVAQVNYHGSSGFGWAFKDSIVGRLATLELQDIEAGSDWLLRQRWADKRRLYAAGASYGGFMVAWMNGHVPAGRYRAYVCHAGVFDRIATFAADSYAQRPKDLDAWYWDDMPKVLAQSPHASAAQMNTPTLVIHGAQDYRVPDANGLAYYNTLKARGVDARLLWFPDENHWVLKPRNSRQWVAEFFAWLARHGDAAAAPAR
ncbi:S9 family peptidase [Aquabacterium sp.]|uniref:S9 family peptidase n=1 Tax=Aquabacterium sp. TaxID=1872578 RepID=UPI002C37E6A3|nr:S9 family peptidase [Aquabacterium sp.]HSW08121.1 S9 family peptidase [Aquabacterium sp.]